MSVVGDHRLTPDMREDIAADPRAFNKLLHSSRNCIMSYPRAPKQQSNIGVDMRKTALQDRLLHRLQEDKPLSAASSRGSVEDSRGGHRLKRSVDPADIVLSDTRPVRSAKAGKRTVTRHVVKSLGESSCSADQYNSETISQIAADSKASDVTLPPLRRGDGRTPPSLSPPESQTRGSTASTTTSSTKAGAAAARKLCKKKRPPTGASDASADSATRVGELSTPRKVKAFGTGGRKLAGAVEPPSATDYDFLRRALSDDKQPFLPPATQRRARSNSLPADPGTGGLTTLQLQKHLQQLAEKSVSEEALPTGDSTKSSATSPTPGDEEDATDNPQAAKVAESSEAEASMAVSPEKHKQTSEWVSSLRVFSPEPMKREPTPRCDDSTTAAAESKPSNTSHGVMPPKGATSGSNSRRQSLNLVVVYGSEDAVEFKPARTRADFVEKKRWDAYPFGRMYQALKLKLSAPNLVILENECDVESSGT